MDMSFLLGEEHVGAGQHVFRKGMCTLGQDWALSSLPLGWRHCLCQRLLLRPLLGLIALGVVKAA